MAKITELGTVYLDGTPVRPGAFYKGERLRLGNTVPGTEVPFLKWEGVYVAAKCVCRNISWEELNSCGFVFGQPVWIDGRPYLCRCLKVGAADGYPNEWDNLVRMFGKDNCVLNWKGIYFWGQEKVPEYVASRAIRGYDSPKGWDHYLESLRSSDIGFRPVLEPLPSEPPVSNDLVGYSIKIYGSGGISLTGRLLEYSDYDLTIKTRDPLPVCSWVKRIRDVVAVDREAVAYFQKK